MENRICAVNDCGNEGKVQICPYDNKLHRHGRIHYDCGYPEPTLKFRKGWHLICDEHYKTCSDERKQFEKAS